MTRITVRWPPPRGGHTDDLLIRLRTALAERYAVQRELGQGGSAVVYLAQDLRHSRPVAIKVLRPELAAIMGAERFLREIETVARLQHPHILPLYDSGSAEGLLYFVMPFVAGESLRDLLDRLKQLPVDQAVAIAKDVASALSFAHSQGVIHRDIKPENILLFGGSAVVADFGISRAITVAGAGRITESNLIPGTPQYMSPEQTAGEDLDGRSDVYSLGIVLYEMLGGEAPFSGFSPVEVMLHQMKDPPRPLAELRPALPQMLTQAIDRALAKRPGDRFATVSDFAEAVRTPSGANERVSRRRRLGRWAAVGAAMAVIAIAVVLRTVYAGTLDPRRYAVMPFLDSGAAGAVDGRMAAHLLNQSLARWSDVLLVDELRVNDAWIGMSRDPARLSRALAAARRIGAGRVVWGEILRRGDSLELRSSLFASRTGHTLSSASAMLPAGHTVVESLVRTFDRMAAGLLAGSPGRADSAEWLGTRSAGAWQAFIAGQDALFAGKLPQALESFGRAIALDPTYPQANLAFAQTAAWIGRPEAEWRVAASAALTSGSRLANRRDTLFARALLAIADDLFDAACAAYDSIIARDSADATAWYGRGECHRADPAVIPDARSPSGLRFRGSLHTALLSYRRALALAPTLNYAFGSQAYGRAVRALYADPQLVRAGQALPPATGSYAAFSSFDADTLAFIPWPANDVRLGRHMPASHDAALAYSRSALRDIVSDWVTAHPQSVDAHLALAQLLEREGNLVGDAPSALTEYRLGIGLSDDPDVRLNAARAIVRLRLKAGAFELARALADSLLRAGPEQGAGIVGRATLAALLGRARRAEELLVASRLEQIVFDERTGRRIVMPTPVAEAAIRLSVRAMAGASRESLLAGEQVLRQEIRRWVPAADQAQSVASLLADGMRVAFFTTGRLPPGAGDGSDYVADLEALVAAGDTARVRERFAQMARMRGSARPGNLDPSSALLEARILLAVGDSAAATAGLGAVLGDLGAARLTLIDDTAFNFGLVRAMALYASLARALGDTAAWRQWTDAVAALWATADPPLRAAADSLRTPR